MNATDMNIDKADHHFKLAMNALVVMCIVLPFLQIFFGEFKWSNFFSSLSIASSMTIATVFFKKTMIKEGYKVKMNSFIYLVALIPIVTIGTIVSSYYYAPVKMMLDVFPVYMMMPLVVYMACIFKCIYKTLESLCSKGSIIQALDLEKKDYTVVMNFSDNIFYEVFGNMKVFIGMDKVADSTVSVDSISNTSTAEKVSELTETPRSELTVDHFTIADMEAI